MKKICLLLLVFIAGESFGQSISVVDLVKIKDHRKDEAFYFYEHNWKVYRDIALQQGLIKSFRMLKVLQDPKYNCDVILITEYQDSVHYNLAESNFQTIIKTARPNGPLLLNELKPGDFRENVGSIVSETLFEGWPKNLPQPSHAGAF